jgi:hypothetical protein
MRALISLCAAALLITAAGCSKKNDATQDNPNPPPADQSTMPATPPADQTTPPASPSDSTTPPADQTTPPDQSAPPPQPQQ